MVAAQTRGMETKGVIQEFYWVSGCLDLLRDGSERIKRNHGDSKGFHLKPCGNNSARAGQGPMPNCS